MSSNTAYTRYDNNRGSTVLQICVHILQRGVIKLVAFVALYPAHNFVSAFFKNFLPKSFIKLTKRSLTKKVCRQNVVEFLQPQCVAPHFANSSEKQY